jgi:hypothetical protein
MYFIDCIEGNSKSGVKLWGAIADSYNSTTETHRHRTMKNLKDHWVDYNKQVSLFNQIYNQESSNMQSGANDDMVLEIESSDTRIVLVLNSSAFTGGKLLGTNPSGGQGQMPHLQWMHLSPRVRLEQMRR